MKTFQYILLGAIAITSALSDSCKKGEGDPLLSFRSRKARVEGEWKVTKYEETTIYTDNTGTATTISSFDGSTWTDTYSTSGGTSTQTSTGTYTYSFTKDGKYTVKKSITTVSGGSTFTTSWEEEGKWDFLSGVGELKNREYIGLTMTKQTITSGSTSGVTSYEGQSYSAWQVTTLKNKEMILHLLEEDSNSSSAGTSSSGSTTIDITLEQ